MFFLISLLFGIFFCPTDLRIVQGKSGKTGGGVLLIKNSDILLVFM